MIEMLGDHALLCFREFETHKAEFLRLDQRAKSKEDRKRISDERYEKAILKKTQGQLKAYRLQKERIQLRTEIELNENSLKPKKLPL